MQREIRSKLKKVVKMEMQRLMELYATEPFDSREAERSVRIIKAAVETLLKIEREGGGKQEAMSIRILLDE